MQSSKIIAGVAALSLAFSALPGLSTEKAASASADYQASSSCELTGLGSGGSPYLLFSATDLLSVSACVSGSSDVFFEQRTNIYLDPARNYPSSRNFLRAFDFNYDGGGFGIFGLNSTSTGSFGLFGEFSNSSDTLSTVRIHDLTVIAGTVRHTSGRVGVIIGSTSYVNVSIESVSVMVDDLYGQSTGGGLIGNFFNGQLRILDSAVFATAISADNSAGGGLVGDMRVSGQQSVIANSYVLVDMDGTGGSGNSTFGGLVGDLRGGNLLIDKSKFEGSIVAGTGPGSTLGGLVGRVITFAHDASLTVRDSVMSGQLRGARYLGGIVGDGRNHNNLHPIDISVSNSLATGELRTLMQFTNGGGVVGRGTQTNLTLDKVVIDLDFVEGTADQNAGNFVTGSPLSRLITNTYVNSTKLAASDWNMDDLSADGYWGATLVAGGNFGLAGSFPGLTFASPNGAGLTGVFEVCPAGTRPIHSIEPSFCSTPAIDYPATLALEFGEVTSTNFVGDPAHYSFFAVSPELPKGLGLNPRTGEIFGQALEASSANNYTISALTGNSSVQDIISISVGSSSAVVTLDPNLESLSNTQSLPVGLITLPTNPFAGSGLTLVGWAVDSPTGPLLKPGDQVLLTEAATVYALWGVAPDCSIRSSDTVGEGFALCKDPNGRAITSSTAITADGLSYFVGSTPLTGSELWVTDGTAQGTSLFLEMEPGAGDGVTDLLAVVGNSIYVGGRKNGQLGIYVTDGTIENTIRLTTSTSSRFGGRWAAVGSKFVFSNSDSTNGIELWVTDGTPNGTSLLADLEQGSDDSDPYGFVSWRDHAYFLADTTAAGRGEMYRTDGTPQGTELFLDFNPGADDSYLYELRATGDKLFFSANYGNKDGLWVFSDPAAPPLKLVAGSVSVVGPTPNGGSVLFGLDPLGNYNINELWVSDGTEAGTVRLKQLSLAGVDSYPDSFHVAGGLAYFNSYLPNGDIIAWQTDLTEEGTVRILQTVSDPYFSGSIGDAVFGQFGSSVSNQSLFVLNPNAEPPTTTVDNNNQPASGGGASLPVVREVPSYSAINEILVIAGSGLNEVFRVEIEGQALLSKFEDGALHIVVPSSLAVGKRGITLTTTAGKIVIQMDFGPEAAGEESVPAAWTKKQSDESVKIYAKDIIGAGKVQLMLNGREIAWVRAVDSTDPKLRFANGAYYLVRTIVLAEGKNVFEVFVDGERVRRVAYTQR